MAHSTKVELKSLVNTRDLGGIRGYQGRKIKAKAIYRSGELTRISDEDLKALYEIYDVRTIIDLRNKTEGRQKPDKLYKGMEYLNDPILNEAHMGMTHEQEMDAETSEYHFVSTILKDDSGVEFMEDLYSKFTDDPYCLEHYKEFIDILSSGRKGAYLYHCSVGKDRVGIGTAYFLKLLGVDESDIKEDFMLTNVFVEEDTKKHIDKLSKRIADPGLEKTYRDLFQVRKDYIESIFLHIKNQYGGWDNFFRDGLKISQEEIDKLRELFLEK
jgi:protein-tyrosine phosphatase